MSVRLSYLTIPLATVAVAVTGGQVTAAGMSWYGNLSLPTWTPPGSTIGTVWTAIFTLAAASAILVWNHRPRNQRWRWAVAVFIINGALNVLWSYLFFGWHLLGLAALEAGLLGASVVVVIVLAWPMSRLAAALLVPYAAWVTFATYLTYQVWLLNA